MTKPQSAANLPAPRCWLLTCERTVHRDLPLFVMSASKTPLNFLPCRPPSPASFTGRVAR
jgi:hypothetical protein